MGSSTHTTRRAALAAVVGVAGGCLDRRQTISGARQSTPSGTHHSDPTYGGTASLWPMLGHDRGATGSTRTALSSEAGQFQRLFEVSGKDRDDAPIHAGDVTLVSRAGDRAGAYGVGRDGSVEWHAPEVIDYTTPVVDGETVLFSGAGHTWALQRATGTVHWHRAIGESGTHRRVLRRDDSVITTGGYRLHALDAYTGERVWQSPELGVIGGPSADDHRLYVTTGHPEEPAVRAIDVDTGDPVWRVDVDGRSPPPVVADGRVYHTDRATGVVSAFDAATGETVWRHDTADADAAPTLCPGGDRLVVTGADAPMRVLSAGDGTELWRLDVRSRWQPLVAGETAFLAAGSRIGVVSLSDRTVTQTVSLPGSVTSPLTLGPRGPMFTVSEPSGFAAGILVVRE